MSSMKRFRSLAGYVVYRLNWSFGKDGTKLCLFFPSGQFVGLEYLALSDELCVATAAGEIVVVPLMIESIPTDERELVVEA